MKCIVSDQYGLDNQHDHRSQRLLVPFPADTHILYGLAEEAVDFFQRYPSEPVEALRSGMPQ